MSKIYAYDSSEFTDEKIGDVFAENGDATIAVIYTEYIGGREPRNGRMVWVDRKLTKVVPFRKFREADDYIRFLRSQTNRSISDIMIYDRD